MKRLLFIIVFLCCHNAYAAKLPDWALEYTNKEICEDFATEDAIILYEDKFIEIGTRSRYTETVRAIIKVINPNGKKHCHISDRYNTKEDKLLSFNAYTLRANGQSFNYGKEFITFVSTDDHSTLYSDENSMYFSAHDDARVGSFFIYEYKFKRKTNFSQLRLPYYKKLSYEELYYRVKLPKNWDLKFHYKNQLEVKHSHIAEENIHSWSKSRTIVEKIEEPFIDLSTIKEALYIDFFPITAKEKSKAKYNYFSSWNDIASHYHKINISYQNADEAIHKKVKELCADKAKLLDKIKALACYAQSINYKSIVEDSSFGGGYAPHSAAEIYSRNYGDCKDKTILFCTMLNCIGIEAFYASCYSGKDSEVAPEWPSPHQFNHAITAIVVPENTQSRAIINSPELGSLLIFDPTDPYTAFGDIPASIQDSWIVVKSPKTKALIKLPSLNDDYEIDKRHFKANIKENGDLNYSLDLWARGQKANHYKALHETLNPKDLKEAVIQKLQDKKNRIEIKEISTENKHDEGVFEMKLSLFSEAYGKNIRGFLLTFKPTIIPWQKSFLKEFAERETAIRLEAKASEETIEFTWPETFELDEIGEDLELKETFGEYSIQHSYEANKLTIKRSLKVKPLQLPKEDYPRVRAFFNAVYESEHTPVVLEQM